MGSRTLDGEYHHCCCICMVFSNYCDSVCAFRVKYAAAGKKGWLSSVPVSVPVGVFVGILVFVVVDFLPLIEMNSTTDM